jgi:hypothetical protein
MTTMFRKEQRNLTEEERDLVNNIKQIAEDLNDAIDMAPPSHERDVALIKLQECVMWAVRSISVNR